jgi:hypothetical protein
MSLKLRVGWNFLEPTTKQSSLAATFAIGIRHIGKTAMAQLVLERLITYVATADLWPLGLSDRLSHESISHLPEHG